MKSNIIIFIILSFLLLSSCAGEENNTTPTPDETSVNSDVSISQDNSESDNTENTIFDYFVRIDVSGYNQLSVRDGRTEYVFQKQVEDSIAYFPYRVISDENGKAEMCIYHKAEEIIEVNYRDVLYDENGYCIGFTIIDDALGEMVFRQSDSIAEYKWEGQPENGYTPIIGINYFNKYQGWNTKAYGSVCISFLYEAEPDYKCKIIFPNGKTTERRVLNVPDYGIYFEGSKIIENFDSREINYKTDSENALKLTLYGTDRYGTGLLMGNFDILSRENGIAVTNTFNGNVYYEEPILESSQDTNWLEGTMTIDKLNYQVSYTEGYGDVNECYIIRMKDLNPEETADLIRIDYDPYYPNEFEVRVYFTWDADGDIYTLNYPNGLTTVKKLCKRDDGVYYFEDYEAK